MKPIIEITGLGKRYPIVHDKVRYGTLRDSVVNFLSHPFKSNQTRESFWALKDINLTINRGDIVGIIGKNGAGKSTLLKILSGITKPTEGKVKLYGRVSSLLEVGTGFHPELTGRENIFLNGVILGMTRKEVAKKFDEIVAFAGIEKFLDTPVKHYSSGMYVRLAFAVAAHLEPDILIVDEVLAVGDAEFQKKCLGKMGEISKEQGRTVLFVSHNMQAIKQLCEKCVILKDGMILLSGNAIEVTDRYTKVKAATSAPVHNFPLQQDKQAQIYSISVLEIGGQPSNIIPIDEDFLVEIVYEIKETIKKAAICLFIYSADNDLLLLTSDCDQDGGLKTYTKGNYKTKIKIPAFLFNVGGYYFNIAIERPYIEYIDLKENIDFRIIDTSTNPKSLVLSGRNMGKMGTILNFTSHNISDERNR